MSLTVQQLNADSSFLLTFKPGFAPKDSKGKFPGSFTILVDPWLTGPSTIFHHQFAQTHHTSPSVITSLRDLHEIDLIIVSQDKTDHCHEETLCTLPRNSKTKILATPKAAKKILSWDHFDDPGIVQEMKAYASTRSDTIIRIPIEPYSSGSAEGEITIANVTNKADITRLHNAVGITYCPPGTLMTTPNGSKVRMDDLPLMARPGSYFPPSPPISRHASSIRSTVGSVKATSTARLPATPPRSPFSDTENRQRPSTSSSRQPNYESVLSVLYTPHSVDLPALQPYIDTHLSRLCGALPVTCLFHAFNAEINPAVLGGIVSAGAPGGVKIAGAVDARYWISAHDEVKDTSGWATKFMTSRVYEEDEVESMLKDESNGRTIKTRLEVLGCGGRMDIRG